MSSLNRRQNETSVAWNYTPDTQTELQSLHLLHKHCHFSKQTFFFWTFLPLWRSSMQQPIRTERASCEDPEIWSSSPDSSPRYLPSERFPFDWSSMVFKAGHELEHKSQFFSQKLLKEILKVKAVALYDVQETFSCFLKTFTAPWWPFVESHDTDNDAKCSLNL